MSKEEAVKQFKSMFPEDIEAVVLTKESYDNYLGIKEYENIQLKQKIEELEEYIEHLKEELEEEKRIEQEDFKAITKLEDRIDKAIEYMKSIENDYDQDIYLQFKEYKEYQELLDILKGSEE